MPLDTFCTLRHVCFSPKEYRHSLGMPALAQVEQEAFRWAMTVPFFSGCASSLCAKAILYRFLCRRNLQLCGLRHSDPLGPFVFPATNAIQSAANHCVLCINWSETTPLAKSGCESKCFGLMRPLDK